MTTGYKCDFKIAVSILGCCAEGGIRTHEAVAVDLKSTPFDRSGTSADVPTVGLEPTTIRLKAVRSTI